MIRGVERAGDGALSDMGGVRIEHLDALTCRFPSGSWSSRNQQKWKTLHPFPKANDGSSTQVNLSCSLCNDEMPL